MRFQRYSKLKPRKIKNPEVAAKMCDYYGRVWPVDLNRDLDEQIAEIEAGAKAIAADIVYET